MTDLIDACKNGDINRVKNIFEKKTKINPNLLNVYGDTALALASVNCNTEIIKL